MNFDFDPESIFQYGSLPLSVTGDDPEEYLSAYADVYLREEIQAEALTRNIGGFSRFLEIAARQHAQLTNLSGISRDAAVPRQTVTNYFEILNDTLLGHWLTPWKLKRATKQVAHSKFYLFDCGVARALSGRLPYGLPEKTMGRGNLRIVAVKITIYVPGMCITCRASSGLSDHAGQGSVLFRHKIPPF